MTGSNAMRRMATVLASLAVALTILIGDPVGAADNFPNLRGTWTGKGEGVFVTSPGSPDHSQFGTVDISLVIDSQQDRRFAGTITMSGETKPIVGVISTSGSIWWSEPGGFVEGQLTDPNTIEGCYVRVSQFSQLAACEVLKRQK